VIAQQVIGLFAPTETPTSIIEQISAATRMVMAEKAYQQMLIEGAFSSGTSC
jgi:tripartite-type tricarboxylate transporter receptor subunit TctC